ncbi:MAG: response regulator [Magnetococcales bacterium]|nr:response regulator [Magnetococcales bacterium]
MEKTILTVDDSNSVREMIRINLENAGYRVIQAQDGVEALEQAKMTRVDLVITDLNMPNMNGLELAGQLRALPDYRFTPIVVLTTEGGADRRAEGKKVGVNGWIVKPFKNPEQLVAAIRKLI